MAETNINMLKRTPGSPAINTFQTYMQRTIQQLLKVKQNLENERKELNDKNNELQKELQGHIGVSRSLATNLRVTYDAMKASNQLLIKEVDEAKKMAKEKTHGPTDNIKNLIAQSEKIAQDAYKKEQTIANYEKKIVPLITNLEALEKKEIENVKKEIDLNIKELQQLNEAERVLKNVEARAGTQVISINEIDIIRSKIRSMLAYTKEKKALNAADMQSTKKAETMDKAINNLLTVLQQINEKVIAETKQANSIIQQERAEFQRDYDAAQKAGAAAVAVQEPRIRNMPDYKTTVAPGYMGARSRAQAQVAASEKAGIKPIKF